MRGILVQSLVSRGVPFEIALETASLIRDRILKDVDGRGEVQADALSQMVDDLLGERYDLERPLLIAPKPVPWVRDSSDSRTPFSKGVLTISLQGSGLEPGDAYEVARELETRLLMHEVQEIDRSELRAMVAQTIEESHGVRAADRYRTWRQVVEAGRPIFVLLGGSTGVGKTSIAFEVARRLEIPRVLGTDSIRQIMRLMFSRDLMPEIHGSTYEVHKLLRLDPVSLAPGAAERDAVVAGFIEQVQRLSVGVRAMLDRAVEENTSLLLEGVNLLPGLLDLDRYRGRAHVISLVVATLDVESYRVRFRARAAKARARAAEKYLEHFDAIVAIQNYMLAEADHLGLPIIENRVLDDTVLSVTRTVVETLRKTAAEDPDESGV